MEDVVDLSGWKTMGNLEFTKWQVMVSKLDDTLLDHHHLKNMRIHQAVPVMWCIDNKNVHDIQSFVPEIFVKISKQTWELMDENDDKMIQLN
jgi:hypothetical protein